MFLSGILYCFFHASAFAGVPVIMPESLQYSEYTKPSARMFAYLPSPHKAILSFLPVYFGFSVNIKDGSAMAAVAVPVAMLVFIKKERRDSFFMQKFLYWLKLTAGQHKEFLK